MISLLGLLQKKKALITQRVAISKENKKDFLFL